MENARKRNIFVSKRHATRIILDQTNIDIAGCSEQSYTFKDSSHKKNIDELNASSTSESSDIVDNAIMPLTNENHHQCLHDIIETGNDIDFENATTVNNTNDNDKQFRNDITAWVMSYNIPHVACNALLKILQQHVPNIFPKDARTLLQTPRQTKVLKLCGGEYFHLGLHNVIKEMLLKSNDEYINLLINIDGLPLTKSSRASLWPILCSNTKNNAVYIVGAYFGDKKPDDSNTFLQFLVNDFTDLINKGYCHSNKVIKIRLFGLICDAPTKSFVLCIKGHTGFYSCTKCTIKGTYKNGRICFPNRTVPWALRTDELFAVNAYKNFQIGYSILNNIPHFLPITDTPLDYMHLVCLGVVKKIMLLWIKGPLSVRLSPRLVNKISHLLMSFKYTTPNNFVRRPRSIRDIKLWKAVEFRNFLLYTGPVVLKDVLKRNIYDHFLSLHIAITIITRPNLCQDDFINFAEALLNHFVISFEILYGKQYISHNIHNLLHLCCDVRRFGPLDSFSAFRFENYMTSIKKWLRKSEKPLQQLLRRYKEMENVGILSSKSNFNNQKLYTCKYLHNNGPITYDYNIQAQYLQISCEKFNINCKGYSDNCCLLQNGLCILVINIVEINNEDIFLIGKKLKYVKDVYELPCKSSNFGITVMTLDISDNIFSWPITDLQCKAWKIPFGNNENTFAIFPLNHTM